MRALSQFSEVSVNLWPWQDPGSLEAKQFWFPLLLLNIMENDWCVFTYLCFYEEYQHISVYVSMLTGLQSSVCRD